MPIYEYRCIQCGKSTEEVQKYSDSPKTDCEHCGGVGSLEKQMSRTSFALKGTGWYSTDYKKPTAGKSPSGS